MSAGLLYSGQGTKIEFEDESSNWKPAYLNIPFLANVYVVKGLAVKAGIQPGFMVSKDDAEDVKTFDFSIPVGLYYEIFQCCTRCTLQFWCHKGLRWG